MTLRKKLVTRYFQTRGRSKIVPYNKFVRIKDDSRKAFSGFLIRPPTGVFLMKNNIIKVFFGFVLYFSVPFSLAQAPVDCYPVCSESQIASAKRYLEAEIQGLSSKYRGFESKINSVQNDISVIRFNQRRGQVGSAVTSTSTSRQAGNQNNSGSSSAELGALNERLDKLQSSLFDLDKEKRVLTAYLDDFSTLVPKKPQAAPPRNRSLTNNPYSDSPDRSLGDADFYYDDDDELVLNVGDFYGLFIGVNQYESDEIVDLNDPVKDAKSLKEVLIANYAFSEEHAIVLEDPTRSELIDTLENLASAVKANDSLLIFYAGHGYWDESFKQGYWLPADARQKSKSSWISNATIRDYIYGIKTKHTLLIADACFSGGLFKTRAAFKGESKLESTLFQMTSRKAITSGTLTEVPDDSVFMKYLIKNLESNQLRHLTSQDLFARFKIAVMNNSVLNQVPQYGVVQGSGDEGGDFIFVKKKI